MMFRQTAIAVGALLIITQNVTTATWDAYFRKPGDYLQTQIDNVKDAAESVSQGIRNGYRRRTSYMQSDHPRARLDHPGLVLSVPALVSSYGYSCETHTVVSQNYVLTVHRIPTAKTGGPITQKAVILQHGLLDSSANFIINGPQKSLGYVLADAGYDVWLPNARGNRDSREHLLYKTNTKEFWNFSFDEIARYDIPAIIDYILGVKGRGAKIGYLGHSMGTTVMFAMLSLRPEYNAKLSVGIALAPAVFMSHMESPLRALWAGTSRAAHAALWLGSYEVGQAEFVDKAVSICRMELTSKFCERLAFHAVGESEEQSSKIRLSQFLSKGGGTSWKTILHMAQLGLSGKFQEFDYESPARNRAVYNSDTPPEYELRNVRVNTTLFWAKNDLMNNEKDVQKLHSVLPETTSVYTVPSEKFNHADYMWANDAPRLINNKVMEILSLTMNN